MSLQQIHPRFSSSLSSSCSSSTCHGRLAYGVRRLRPGASRATFQKDFEAWLRSSDDSFRRHFPVALAFPDPSDTNLMHLLFWENENDDNTDTTETNEEFDFSSVLLLGSASNEQDDVTTVDDTVLDLDMDMHIYSGGYKQGAGRPMSVSVPVSSQGLYRHVALAGYMRPDCGLVRQNQHQRQRLPMIGVFRRAVRPGERDDLVQAFQRVCDIWYDTVPGILAAFVTSADLHDDDDDNDTTNNKTTFVYDVRIFADKESYDAHVDKSNNDLTSAMKEWFSHYDTSIPHTGAMFAESQDTSDPTMKQSSIQEEKGRPPVQANFHVFHYGQNGCMGRCLDTEFF